MSFQACAAVGQSRLVGLYQEGLHRLGVTAAQVLLTQSDFSDRGRYLKLRSALTSLLSYRVIPVVNENDVVATDELAIEESTDDDAGDGDDPSFGQGGSFAGGNPLSFFNFHSSTHAPPRQVLHWWLRRR